VTRRLAIRWPDPVPFHGRDGPIRILAASDELEPTLQFAANREKLGPIDLIVCCGDLEPHWLAFLADSFNAPLHYVRGNHDRGIGWLEGQRLVPEPLPDGVPLPDQGLHVVGLSWPGSADGRPERNETKARFQAFRAWWRARRRRPLLLASHVPPAGMGDGADPYHLGFEAYRWLFERLQPPLWLHGHTTVDPSLPWHGRHGDTIVANVTGAVLVELQPPDSAGGETDGEQSS
jgi:uncharacterized protein